MRFPNVGLQYSDLSLLKFACVGLLFFPVDILLKKGIMKRVHLGLEICAPALSLVIAALLLTGCAKTSSVNKPVPSDEGVDAMFAAFEGKTAPQPGAEASQYAMQIQSAIQSHFQDTGSYTGKRCALRIMLAPDGMLLAVRAEEGDPDLCRAAIKAATKARFPKPPSPAVYDALKNPILEFRP
ncbi:cell envelope integrity protein TolA [Serratia sp. PAMC26656]|uniref:cell envelope integrity protein TolA n=1 Tax=Serratia sp. PAMC26656 TaxID=2775909 RepID=UPI0018F393D5|nr:cell envelope integrity protein TolA [Serratia sp. PAMC26656]MBJ7893664.1 cell envelope integrity protein TolA [Serratia sp. PAMC26656]